MCGLPAVSAVSTVKSFPYRLIDSGAGARFEEIAGVRVQRPCPSAVWNRGCCEWMPELAYHPDGSWSGPRLAELEASSEWALQSDAGFELGLWPGANGQLGAFPEQQLNWRWIRDVCQRQERSRPLRILNLFAYTGGTHCCGGPGSERG